MEIKLPSRDRIVSKSKDIIEEFLKWSKRSLPHVARLCLVGTYIDDGIRMWFDWSAQSQYMEYYWKCGSFLANLFVIVNLLGQLIGASLVIAQKYATTACGILLSITLLQVIAYNILWDVRFLLRNLAIIGGVVLLLADSRSEGRRIFAGLPSPGEEKSRKPIVLLSGRILLVLMYLTLLNLETDVMSLIKDLVGCALVLLIAFGYKTKAASLILAAWLAVINLYLNAWWMLPSESVDKRDMLKYSFFQSLSVIGGFLLVTSLGPGGISVDKHLKQW